MGKKAKLVYVVFEENPGEWVAGSMVVVPSELSRSGKTPLGALRRFQNSKHRRAGGKVRHGFPVPMKGRK